MNGYNFDTKDEFEKFISKIKLDDIFLVESNSKVLSLAGRAEENLESDISLGDIDIDIIHNPENKKDFIMICGLGCNFQIKKGETQFLTLFAKIQAIYRVEDLDLEDSKIKEIATNFTKESAFMHIVSYLRVYILDIVTKSGYPRFTLPLFKQLQDTEFEKIDDK